MADELSQRYGDLLEGSYDCVDCIVLNAYFRLCYSGGGFREWWRRLMGSEGKLDNAHLMRIAGRFSRRGERKHEIAEEYLATHDLKRGLFLILVGRAIAPVWDVQHWSSGAVRLGKKTHVYQGEQLLYPHHQRRAPGEARRHPGRRSSHRAADPGMRALDLFDVFVLRARLERARTHRISLRIVGLPGRIQPQPAVPFRRANGGSLSAHGGSHARDWMFHNCGGHSREATPASDRQTNVRATPRRHARDT
jgi:hypothetical protein